MQTDMFCLQPDRPGIYGLHMSPHAEHHHWCLARSETAADRAGSMLQCRAAIPKLTIDA